MGVEAKDAMPPFLSLRVFEAAARSGSFARAADELGISAGAVSQHIRAIEEFAGQPLFRRLGRGVELTPAGQAAFAHAGAALEEMLEAGRAMRAALRGRRVSISAAPSFASKWLIPRLDKFQEQHPDVEVRLSADMTLTDFSGSDMDLAVRYGPGGYDGLYSERLMTELVVVVCSPRLLEAHGKLHTPADLTGAPLIHDDSPERDPTCPSWAMWFAARGIRRTDVERGLRFNQSSLAIEAAVGGKGLALAKRQLALRDLADGPPGGAAAGGRGPRQFRLLAGLAAGATVRAKPDLVPGLAARPVIEGRICGRPHGLSSLGKSGIRDPQLTLKAGGLAHCPPPPHFAPPAGGCVPRICPSSQAWFPMYRYDAVDRLIVEERVAQFRDQTPRYLAGARRGCVQARCACRTASTFNVTRRCCASPFPMACSRPSSCACCPRSRAAMTASLRCISPPARTSSTIG